MDAPRSGLSDTDPEAAKRLVEAHRRMSSRQKMERVVACNAAAEAMARAGLRSRLGDLPEREVQFHLAALRLGRSVMLDVFGWDPDRPGADG